MAVRTTALTTPSQSTTGTLKRSVADTIRHLFPENPTMALVNSGVIKMGQNELPRKRGLIGKRRVETPKYEAFTYTPQAVTFTCSSKSSNTEFDVSSADGLTLKMCLLNTDNMTVCRISAISSTTITVVSVGSTSFSLSANDTLLALGPAYAENSNSPYILMKDPDNMYNYTQIFRFTCAMSRTAKGNPHYGGQRWALIKEENSVEGMRKVENTLLFSERGSSETTTDSTLGDSFRTMRGLWNWAQSTHNANGQMTHENYISDLPDDMHETMGGSRTKLVQFCGSKIYGLMLRWAQDKLIVQQNDSGEYKKLGVEATKFLTSKGYIEVIKHDAFDRGELSKSAMIFAPELVDYVYLRGDDFKIKSSIQNNDVDGQQDEIIGEASICPRDAGYSIMKVTNWY